MTDVVIIGGGVMGLLLARELNDSGADVTVVERGQCAREASWAGGGIVSPLYPWRYNHAVTALASWAQDFYPSLSDALLDETGIDPELERCGLLMLDADDADQALQWARLSGRRMSAEGAAFLYGRQPDLGPGFGNGLWMPDVSNIRNPRLARSLGAALRLRGVVIHEQAEVVDFDQAESRLNAVVVATARGPRPLPADSFVFCTGAWTGTLLGPLGMDLPVTPVKGQMLLFRLPQQRLRQMLLHQGRYLIPRRDGHILVGSTLEHAGFDKSTTEHALHVLRRDAIAMLPILADYPVKQQWAGLRPCAPEGIPYIGRLPGLDNTWINAGHYRNGLVLAPASARLMADLLCRRPPIVDTAPYDPAARAMDNNQSSPSFLSL